jgi:hypothetical protein
MSQLPTQPSPQAMQDALAQQQAEVNQTPTANPLAFLQGAAQPQPAQPQVAQQPPQPQMAQPQVVQQPQPQVVQQQPAPVPAVQQPQQTALASPMMNDAPAWLVDASKDAPSGLETVSNMLLPPKLMIRQGLTNSDEVRNMFREGEIYLAPDLRKLWTHGEQPVRFTPILCFSEWTLNNPNGMKPFVIERTTDPNHKIARASRNAETRSIPIPGSQDPKAPGQPLYKTAVEHLTFLVVLHIENGPQMPVLLDFSKAGLMHGKRFNNLIVARNQPLYAGVYELSTATQVNQGQTFHVWSVTNPAPGTQWVSPEQFNLFKTLHIDLAQKREAGEIGDFEEDAPVDAVPQQQPVNYGPPQGVQQPVIVGYTPAGQPIYAGQQQPQQVYYPPQPQAPPAQQPPVYGHQQPMPDVNAQLNQAAVQAQPGYRGL